MLILTLFHKDLITLIGIEIFFILMLVACIWAAGQEDAIAKELFRQRMKDQKKEQKKKEKVKDEEIP